MRSVNEISPFELFVEMEHEIDCIGELYRQTPERSTKKKFFPCCEVSETNDYYKINFDLPGIPKNDIKVDLEAGELRVSGERINKHKENGYSEKFYGKFKRAINLPDHLSTDNIEANFEDGVLTVNLRKNKEPKIKRVDVGTTESSGLWTRVINSDNHKIKSKLTKNISKILY